MFAPVILCMPSEKKKQFLLSLPIPRSLQWPLCRNQWNLQPFLSQWSKEILTAGRLLHGCSALWSRNLDSGCRASCTNRTASVLGRNGCKGRPPDHSRARWWWPPHRTQTVQWCAGKQRWSWGDRGTSSAQPGFGEVGAQLRRQGRNVSAPIWKLHSPKIRQATHASTSTCCYSPKVCPLQNSYAEIHSQCDSVGRSGLWTPQERDQNFFEEVRTFSVPSAMWGHRKKVPSMKPPGLHHDAPFPVSTEASSTFLV